METKVVDCQLKANAQGLLLFPSIACRVAERFMDAETWIDRHASGTLRKNKRIGFAWKSQYWHERISFEFGYIWEHLPRTRAVYNDAITEGDCHSISEAGWHAERFCTLSIFHEDQFEVKYIIVEESDGKRREGIGMICKQTSFPIPEGNLLFCIISEFDLKTKEFLPAKNPF